MKKCILYAEDDEREVHLLRLVFERAGLDLPLIVVGDGQAAIDYLWGAREYADRERYPLPCLMLLDLKMPKVTGLGVLEWMHQHPHLRKIVVVVFSSSARPEDIEQAYALGANAFVEKPVDFARMDEFVRLLKRWWFDYNSFASLGGQCASSPENVSERRGALAR